MSANGHETIDLCARELRLVELYPWIPWLEPQTVQVGEARYLTCRLCTALDGLRAVDLEAAAAPSFADQAEHQAHVRAEHVR